MCAVISAGMPAATARAKGTSSSAASARRERRTRGRTKCESPALAPCPGKCFPQASTPARPSPRASATPRRATRAGSVPKARSPITRLRGLDQTSSTGAKSRSMPTARSSRPMARPTASARRGSRRAPTTAAGGKCVNGRGSRSTRPPSWSSATSGRTPAPAAGSARRTAVASGLLPQPSMRPARRPRRRSEAGIAMAIALFTLMVFIVLAATSSLIASSDVRATRDARGGSQAHFVAEAAIAEALQRVNAPGVVNFQNDVVGQWAGLWGAGTHTFGPVSGCTYTVTPVASATDPTNAGRLIATANGRESVHNVVVANDVRSDIPSTAPGAIYLANDQATNATFKGDSFSIDGNDHNYTGGAGSAPPVPGLSTRNDANRQEAVASLDAGQKDNIRGLGFSSSPLTPSIMTSPAAPSIAQMNQIIDDLLALPSVVPYGDNNINGHADFGTNAAPQISHFTNPD